ncbi:MAG TPA: hypothetical protein VJ873_04785, partial [bacterium]|nr:hypothetical protein [bacterium]
DMNEGAFDASKYVSIRFSAGVKGTTTTQPSNVPIPDSASFTLGGASLFMGGGISKNFFAYSELGFGNGTGIFPGTVPSFSDIKMGYVTGTETDFWTIRAGKFNADGFAGSDRGPVGNASIASVVRPVGTGAELGYTHDDTRITLGFYNGIQNAQKTGLVSTSNGAPVTSNSIQAPTSDNNNAKDFQIFVNQFIGDDGLAVNATYYNGFNESIGANGNTTTTADADWAGQEYYNAALFVSSPVVKNLDVKAGGELGQTNAGVFSTTGKVGPTTGGVFAELDYEMDEITPLGLRWDYTATDLNKQYTDTQKFTFGALTPVVENIYLNPQYTLTMTDAAAGYTYAHAVQGSLNVFF